MYYNIVNKYCMRKRSEDIEPNIIMDQVILEISNDDNLSYEWQFKMNQFFKHESN